ncbi:MAG: bifunctional DNA-formamidopyrimidine glycosylase/DNA-(apurinic or apyrimidinic site) lyase [Candidatus Cloacimonadales bacterium]
MPELPEVQTVVSGLQQRVLGKQISELIEHRAGTIIWHCTDVDFGRISAIERRGKYIIIILDNALKIVVHLRMTGKLIYETEPGKISSHARAEILFADDSKLIFDDVRTFGKIEVAAEDYQVAALARLGVEPLSADFTAEYLQAKLLRRQAPIKNLLLDQAVIAGIGNIYAAEILFRIGMNPTKAANLLNRAELQQLVQATKQVLSEALQHNGTTISDYRSVEDKSGEFQNFLNVYGKEFCSCGAKIQRIKQAGRTTFYCEACQPK